MAAGTSGALLGGTTLGVLASGVALGAVLGGLAAIQPRWAVVAMVVAVGVTAFVYTRLMGKNLGLLVLLIVTCLIDRHTFPLSRVSLRPEQIAALIALAVFAVERVRSGRALALELNLAEIALGAWFLVGFVSSVLLAPSRSQSIKILALLVVSSLALALPRRLSDENPAEIQEAVRWLLLALATESAYTLFTYFLRVFGPIISLSINPAGGHLNAYGTLWEPNVLGAVCGAGAVAWTYLGPRHFERAWIGIALCLGATVVSFTRFAWIAVAFVLVISLAPPLRRLIDLRTLRLGIAVALVMGLGVLAADRIGNYYPPAPAPTGAAVAPAPSSSRIFGVLGNSVDVLGRLYQFEAVFADLRGRPLQILLGGGVDSFGERHTNSGVPQHLANLELTVFNDTGIVGLLVFGVFAFAIARAVWPRRTDPTVAGLGAMVLVIAITNQSTETLELMITWLLIGLLLAAGHAAGVSSSTSARRGPGIAA